MSVVIAPTVGQGVVFTQQGAGTTPGYSAIDLRRAFLDGAQEGVIAKTAAEADGWMVTERAAGANNSVDIAASVACARVQGDSVTQQGLYTVAPHSATINLTIAAADVTNPRIDQVILEVLDNVHDASGSSLARLRILTGTPTAGATNDNRLGAAALPGNAVRWADLFVANSASGTVTLSNASIRDRRPFARGANYRILRNSANYTTTSTSEVEVDATNLKPRIECSGVPVRITVHATVENSGINLMHLGFFQDGARIDAVDFLVTIAGAAYRVMPQWSWVTVPSAGSHRFSPTWSVGGGTGTVYASAANPLVMTVEEIVRQNVQSNSVTSG